MLVTVRTSCYCLCHMLADINYSSVDMVQGQEMPVRESNKGAPVCDVTENTEGNDSSE